MKIRSEAQLVKHISNERKAKKWSQTQLAEEAAMSQQAISNIESGKASATLPTIFKLLNALELDITVSDRNHG